MSAITMTEQTVDKGKDDYFVSRGYAWYVMALVWLLYALDLVDRQIVVSMFPYLKQEWALSDTQLGGLVTAVSAMIALLVLPASILVDRWSRAKAIAVMGIGWSIATIACAFAGSYLQLLIARAAIGVGEAGYGPGAGALIAKHFPARLRGMAFGVFNTGALVGSVLGVVLGGAIAAKWGWHYAFGVVGVPGLIVALLCFSIRDYKTIGLQQLPTRRPGGRPQAADFLRALFGAPSAIAAYFGSAVQLLVFGTLSAWLPSYFNRAHGLAPDQAGLRTALFLITATVGMAALGWLIDRWAMRRLRHRLVGSAIVALASAACLVPAFTWAEGTVQMVLLAVGCFLVPGTAGPANAVAVDVIHPALRAVAIAMIAVVQNVFGLGVAPLLAGWLSDHYGLVAALGYIPLVSLLSAAIFLAGSLAYERDLARLNAQLS